MYSPKIKEDLIPALFWLSKEKQIPMTRLVDQFIRDGLRNERVKEKQKYQSTEELRKILSRLKGQKFKLDCGHHVTFGHFLGNNITIINGKRPKIICSLCGY